MTNEELSQKILNDIQYIKERAELFQKTLIDHNLEDKQLHEIRSVLNYFRTADFTFISTLNNQEGLLNLENQFSPYKISIEALLDRSTQQRLNNFLANNSKMYEFIGNVINTIKKEFTSIDQDNKTDVLQEIYKRIEILEQEQKPLNDIVIRNEQNEKAYSNEINEIKEKIVDLQSSETQIEITKKVAQAKQLFDKAKDSQTLFNDEVKKLISAKERQIAYTLSEQFSKKTDSLKRPIWINFTLIFILILVLSFQGMKYVELMLDPKITNEAYWHALVMVLLIKVPIIFLIFFVLNEYTKAKKLFEEYEHKRIMAATLVNNLERLKNELHADEKDLLELIKVPFEKIFDNPVHSIYGNKSGNKNIGLDQLEKITSIIEKMKK